MAINFPNAFTSATTATGAQLDANFAAINSAANTANGPVFLNGTSQLPAVDGSLLTNLPIPATGVVSQVRQTVLTGSSSAGLPNALSIGTGLAVNLSATATPMVLSAAKGFGASGAVDQIEVISADATGIVTLPAWNTSYIYRTLGGLWGSTLAPPQYGYAYNQAAQSSLTLNNVSTDDFGNTWTNTSVTFANSTPQISSTYYGVFNGSSSYLLNTSITSVGSGGWALRGWFNPASLAALQTLFSAPSSSATFGMCDVEISTGGKTTLLLSSTGTSWDQANGTVGTATLVVGTWYFVELTYDPINAKYYLYVNGVVDQTITATAKASAFNKFIVGAWYNGTVYNSFFNGKAQGFEFLPYCQHPAGITYSIPTTLASVSVAGYASEWFSLNDMKFYSVSAASSVAGTNPTFTSSVKVYAGQGATNLTTVTSATTYAYQGKFDQTYLTTSGATNYNHNIGVVPIIAQTQVAGVTSNPAVTLTSTNFAWTATTASTRVIAQRGW